MNDSNIFMVGLKAKLFGLLPNVWCWIQGLKLLWSTKNMRMKCGGWPTICLLAHLPPVTSIGHGVRATSYIQEPLQFSFPMKSGDPPSSSQVCGDKCNELWYSIWSANILSTMFWFKQLDWRARIQLGWSSEYGHMKSNLLAFAAVATIIPLYMNFGCDVIVNTLPFRSALLEEYWHL